MSSIPTSTSGEPDSAEARHRRVEVSLEITNEEGESETSTLVIESGPTKVTELKSELGIAEDASLWVIKKDGKKKPLGDHEKHDVKQGDRYQALVRGGVS
jgi:hypothetical protein